MSINWLLHSGSRKFYISSCSNKSGSVSSWPCKVVENLISSVFALQILLVIQGNWGSYTFQKIWGRAYGLAAEVAHWKAFGFGGTVCMSNLATVSLIPPEPRGPGFRPRHHVTSLAVPHCMRIRSTRIESCLSETSELFPSWTIQLFTLGA